MLAKDIRQSFLNFFKNKNHVVIPSASLIPENDPSVLFTTAGMHPLVPFLLGEQHPAGSRLTNAQKCIRTGDIDEVGDNVHLTFFEMLGNWSLGDYWKKEAINWSYEFLTSQDYLALDKNKLAITIFIGDDDCPFDQESYEIWLSLGIPEKRIVRLGKDDNWWPAGGKNTGPQGPDTEMFYWAGKNVVPEIFDPNDKNWVEIWNNVFMQYERKDESALVGGVDSLYKPLKQKNLDTGFGLERATAILQGKDNVYETELFQLLFAVVNKHCKLDNTRAKRIVVDHLRAAIFIMADDIGIRPGNVNQSYVIRKLLRRAIRNMKALEGQITEEFVIEFYNALLINYQDLYIELVKNKESVIKAIVDEDKLFGLSLEKGLKFFNSIKDEGNEITGANAFILYSTYGFPIEMTVDLAKEIGKQVDVNQFNIEFTKHQNLSRTASAGMFKGGLAGQSEQIIKYHTATHLLHQALKNVLGNHVHQKGSNITDERLRFDFSHNEKMTAEQLAQVELLVNQCIKNNLPVKCEEMSPEKANDEGAIGLFGDKYGDVVKVYSIGDFSKEICGGPHVKNTGELGIFKIIKEEASSANIRRIKAILT
jgi:alanyl-tRNA synthetase